MLRLVDPGIAVDIRAELAELQTKVSDAGDYASQVEAAARTWKAASGRSTMDEVRSRLALMCAGAKRCGWCEDSAAGEIDHIRPKSLYPERTFAWENYLLRCGSCNNKKGRRFAVLVGGTRFTDVTRRQRAAIRPPVEASPVLIDPRREDPLQYLHLDLADTFWFADHAGLSEIDQCRARYTIDLLRLNRDELAEARREGYGNFRARLHEYRQCQADGHSEDALRQRAAEILRSAHPTVWREMCRQWRTSDELQTLFGAVPEALTW